MIKEGKKRVIATLEQDISNHLDTWTNVSGYSKSDIINIALRLWFISKGDTFGNDESDEILREIRRKRK